MGDEAEVKKEEIDETEVDETQLPDEAVDETEESTEEVEIYLEGADESPEGKEKETEQDRINAAVQKRLAREKRKHSTADDEAVKQVQANALLQEENKLQKLRIDQLQQRKELSPDDFDDGVTDPKYLAALMQQTVAAQTPAQPTPAAVVPKDNTEAIRAHCTAAINSKLPDYDEQEDKVIEEIGVEAHNYIVNNFPSRSHLVTYALAKNPGKLVELGNHVRSGDNQKALLLLGEISATAKVRKVSKAIPDPVDEVEGSKGVKAPGLWEKKLDKLRDKVADGSAEFSEIVTLKKQALEKGVTL